MGKAAFIGLGAMGSRMAANLLKAGYEVTVSDPAQDAVRKLVDLGAKVGCLRRQRCEQAQRDGCAEQPVGEADDRRHLSCFPFGRARLAEVS